MGAAAEGPHPECKVPPVLLLKAIYEFLQVCAPPYHSHQDYVFNYTIGEKAGKVNIAAGINQAHVEWVKRFLAV